jgi:dipeptidase E
MNDRHVFALGGGGFSMAEQITPLERYLLGLSFRQDRPKICFIPTASGDSDSYQLKFYRAFSKVNCEMSHLSLFSPPEDLEQLILDQNIVYVGGGNTYNLLTLWRSWGFDKLLIKAYHQGTILAGVSAGSLCWFDEGLSDSFGKKLKPLTPCLGIINHSNCPHYSDETPRREGYLTAIREGQIKGGFACKDNTALHFVNEQFKCAVGCCNNGGAYYIDIVEGELSEKPLEYFNCSNSY